MSLHLNDRELEKKDDWEKAGVELPRFDRAKMIEETEKTPEWVHFGAGNIFRIFPLALQQELLEKGFSKTGVIMVAGRDGGIVEEVFKPHDNLTLAVTLKVDGTIRKKVIASAAASLWMGKGEDFETLKKIFRAPSLKMASLTITEKAYNLKEAGGGLKADAAADCGAGPEGALENYLAKITALLYERYKAGALPLALVSMDNCSRNGDKLFAAVETFASAWAAAGKCDKGFIEYITDRKKTSFPWTMIDKITPGPDAGVVKMLEESGFADTAIYKKTTPTAPFVNAEEPQYLVVEDSFPAGRPPLEKTGVLFTAKETVDKVEKMKVCACLNPLHTALAITGCLLGYTRISDEMKNPALVRLIEGIGYAEALPAVADPGIIDPKKFINEVITVRFPNPFMPDTPQRIATDSSQKIPVRYGETIKAYLRVGALDIQKLKFIPFVIAAWLRYLMGITDTGEPFTPSPDPRLADLAPRLVHITLGDKGPFHEVLKPILSDKALFTVDLYEAGLAVKVENYFAELVSAPGAVEKTLEALGRG